MSYVLTSIGSIVWAAHFLIVLPPMSDKKLIGDLKNRVAELEKFNSALNSSFDEYNVELANLYAFKGYVETVI
jgi:hypothetical protein